MPRFATRSVGRYPVLSQTTAVSPGEVKAPDSSRSEIGEPPLTPATLCEVTDTPQAAITLTDQAAEKIRELLGSQHDGGEQALRVAVRVGCFSGFQSAL